MHIGIVSHPVFGGSGVVAVELAKNLKKKGYKVHLISYKEPVRFEKKDGIYFHKVFIKKYPLFPHPFYTLDLAAKIKEVVERYNIALLHAHYAIPHTFSCLLARNFKGEKVKIITTLHGTDIYIFGEDAFYKSLMKFAIEESDGVTAVSLFLKKKTDEILNSSKDIKVIPNFVDTERFCREKNFDQKLRRNYAEDNEKLILHVSNFRPIKRVPYIIEIFSEIRKRCPSRLLLVGNGPQVRETKKKAKELGILEYVYFLGPLKEVEKIFCICDLLLNLSTVESFCLAALEALSCNVPVIATKVGGLPEVVEDGVCGYLLDDEPSSIIEASVEVLKDKKKREKFGKRGREIAIEKFSADKIVPEYERFYDEVMKR